MKSNELSVGNIVFVHGLHGERFMTVRAITDKGSLLDCKRVIFFNEDNAQVGEFLEHCHVIPLNENWLLNFGFKLYSDSQYRLKYELKEFEFIFPKIKEYHKKGLYFKDIEIKNVKYVHQLQNLYFFLTGEELILVSDDWVLLK
jgi:hypothetical protein